MEQSGNDEEGHPKARRNTTVNNEQDTCNQN
jgi:hypothetical protein